MIKKVAESVQKKAWRVVEESGVVRAWESIGAQINLVGSLRTGLLINNRDIDFHIYTNPFKLEDSFKAVSRLAKSSRITSISNSNLLESEDKCIEWHALYEDQENQTWQIDMMHILCDSPYAGFFERVAERISAVLTSETRDAILRIKNSVPGQMKIPGILVYKAVIEHGIRTTDEFLYWEEKTDCSGIVNWIP